MQLWGLWLQSQTCWGLKADFLSLVYNSQGRAVRAVSTQFEAFPGAKPWYSRAVAPSWRRDRLYQHSLDCVILAWDSCPFPAPCLPVLPRGPDQTWICGLIWVKGKKKAGKGHFYPSRRAPRAGMVGQRH